MDLDLVDTESESDDEIWERKLHQDMAMERPKYRDHRSVAIWVTWLHRHMVHQAEHRIDGR
jgi:hypothetical protein